MDETLETRQRIAWGWTEAWLRCDCGKHKTVRLIGDHSGLASADELAELERMAKK